MLSSGSENGSEEDRPFGPAPPPPTAAGDIADRNSPADDFEACEIFGPAAPPSFNDLSRSGKFIANSSNSDPLHGDQDDDNEYFGPSPPLRKNNENDDYFGPAPPQPVSASSSIVGPQLTSNFDSNQQQSSHSFHEGIIGPSLDEITSDAAKESNTVDSINQRALLMKHKITNPEGPAKVTRESWMTEIPSKKSRLGTFTSLPTVQRSSDVNEGRSGGKKEETKQKSLLDIHQKKVKKKLKKEKKRKKEREKESHKKEKPERRPFDRDVDLKISGLSSKDRQSVISQSQILNSRFAHSAISKYE